MSKKRFKISLIIMVLSLFFPLVKLYYIFFPLNIKPFEDALIHLGQELNQQAKKQKLKGYIQSVEKITGPEDEEIEKLKYDINLILGSYKGWKVVVPDDKKAELNKRKEKDLKEKKKLIDAGLLDAKTYIRFLAKSKAITINYNAFSHWDWSPGSKINCRIFLAVPNPVGGNIFDAMIVFTHPRFLSTYLKRVEIITFAALVSAGTFAFSFLFLIGSTSIGVVKRRKIIKVMPEIMAKLEGYIKNGGYVATQKLITQTKYYIGPETDLINVERRLKVVTKDNLYDAEKAYVRFVNLRTKLERTGSLAPEEYEELAKLPQYLDLPEINTMVGLCQKRLTTLKLSKDFRNKTSEIKALLSQGNLEEAKMKAYGMEKDSSWEEYQSALKEEGLSGRLALPSPKNLGSLRKEIEEKLTRSHKNLEKAKESISQAEIDEAENLLKEAVNLNRGLKEAGELLEKIEKSREAERIRLIPEKIGKEIQIFKKDTIILARRDKEIPDIEINHPKISRDKHLKISIVENKMIAEDMNSSNGTYHQREKIRISEIEDGDILDLAHTYRIVVHISRGKEIVNSTLVTGTIPEKMKIDQQAIVEDKKIGGLFMEADDKNYLVVLDAVNIAFKSVGVVYERAGDYQIALKNEVLLLLTPEGCQILYPGGHIEQHGVRYKVA